MVFALLKYVSNFVLWKLCPRIHKKDKTQKNLSPIYNVTEKITRIKKKKLKHTLGINKQKYY